jgi:hypothetical protein
MKKLIYLLVCVAGFISTHQANAQIKKNLLKTSLIFPMAGGFSFSYERLINHEMSLQLTTAIGGDSFLLVPEFRYYLTETKIAPSGTFVGPMIVLGNEAGAGLMVGVQRLFKQKISLEAYLGPLAGTDGVGAFGNINIGFAF